MPGAKADTEIDHRALPPEPSRLRHLLVVAVPGQPPRLVELADGAALVVGREAEAQVRIDDRAMSRRHASLLRRGETVEVRDLESKNGVWVNERRLGADSVALRAGDRIRVGPATLTLAVLPDAPDAGAPAPGPEDPLVLAPSMRELWARLPRIAASPLPVLVRGETGVGKDVVATALHRASKRSAGPFVRINCAAIPEALIEGELFGYERGAFTGADRQRVGQFEAASGGTLFLDEVGELPGPAQAKLLRVLESGALTRLGGNREIPVDLRVVSATHRDLEQDIERGRFRADLFYRLNGLPLVVPPLRERREEIVPLARRFAERFAARMGEVAPALSAAAIALLEQAPWPGNVRELRHAIERACVLANGGVIERAHLAVAAPAPGPSAGPLRQDLETTERDAIAAALAAHAGNRTHAARALGISRRALLYKIAKHGLEGEER